MKLVRITKPSQIKVNQRYRTRETFNNGKSYNYFEFWIDPCFYSNGYKLKYKLIGKKLKAERLSDCIKYRKDELSRLKRVLFNSMCDPDFNTVWAIGIN